MEMSALNHTAHKCVLRVCIASKISHGEVAAVLWISLWVFVRLRGSGAAAGSEPLPPCMCELRSVAGCITAPPSLPPRQPPSLPGTTIQLSHKQVKLNNLSGIPPASCVSVTHTNTAIRSVLRDRSPGVIYHPSLFLNDHLLSLCLCPA